MHADKKNKVPRTSAELPNSHKNEIIKGILADYSCTFNPITKTHNYEK